MGKFSIEMLGAPELSRIFDVLPDAMERTILNKALKEAGKVLLLATKARAPREQGLLASTMKLKALKRSRRRVGYMVQTGTRAELGIDPKDKSYYPAHVEFGHKTEQGAHVPPNPYMRSSLRSSRDGLLAILRQEVEAGIERELRKAGA